MKILIMTVLFTAVFSTLPVQAQPTKEDYIACAGVVSANPECAYELAVAHMLPGENGPKEQLEGVMNTLWQGAGRVWVTADLREPKGALLQIVVEDKALEIAKQIVEQNGGGWPYGRYLRGSRGISQSGMPRVFELLYPWEAQVGDIGKCTWHALRANVYARVGDLETALSALGERERLLNIAIQAGITDDPVWWCYNQEHLYNYIYSKALYWGDIQTAFKLLDSSARKWIVPLDLGIYPIGEETLLRLVEQTERPKIAREAKRKLVLGLMYSGDLDRAVDAALAVRDDPDREYVYKRLGEYLAWNGGESQFKRWIAEDESVPWKYFYPEFSRVKKWRPRLYFLFPYQLALEGRFSEAIRMVSAQNTRWFSDMEGQPDYLIRRHYFSQLFLIYLLAEVERRK